jgi:hypothetical protein
MTRRAAPFGHWIAIWECPFFPSKRTFISAVCTSVKCQKRTCASRLQALSTPVAKLSWVWSRPRGVGIDQNQRINPVQSKLPMHLSPRCGARTRRGSQCQSPAMPNGRCRMHGGKSPGAPKGNKNALKHGRYTAEAIAKRREVAVLLRTMKALAELE